MTTKIVSSDCWLKCFTDACEQYDFHTTPVYQYLQDIYGITKWYQMNFDQYEISFDDEKKMTYWLLRWS